MLQVLFIPKVGENTMIKIKDRKFWQITAMILLFLSFLFVAPVYRWILWIYIGVVILYVIALAIAKGKSLDRFGKFLDSIWHWFVEALEHSWVWISTIASRKHTVRGREFRLGWPIGAILLLACLVWNGYWLRGPVQPTAAPNNITSALPIGSARINLTGEALQWRVNRMIDTRTFYLLREDGAEAGAQKVTGDAYRDAIQGASRAYQIDADILEAHVFLESMGSEQAQSPTGPKGPGQFAALTAANLWEIKDGRYLLRYKGQEKDVAKNHRRTAPLHKEDIIEDNRDDIELSVYAEAKLLKEEKDFFGRQDFASASYHSGRDKIRKWVMMYLSPKPVTSGGKKDIEANNLSYDSLYFGSTPYTNPGTYKMFRDLMAQDFGANYWYKILCARKLLALYRLDKSKFHELAAKQRYNGKRASNRMWTFYGPDDAALLNEDDLRTKLENGELVTIPNDPRFGFTLRFEGSDAIGALDRKNQQLYIATKKETAGTLLYVAQEVMKLRNGRPSVPMEVTSVSRTVQYQNKLRMVNPVATSALSFHVLGLAFDITKAGMSADDQRDIQFILDELDSVGYISWVPENAAYHVVVAPDPDGIAFFQKAYDEATYYRQASPLVIK